MDLPNPEHVLRLAQELNLKVHQVAATAQLLAEGGTVPFISRYRKEATGLLDEVQVTAIRDRLEQMKAMDERRAGILASLKERNLLTPELEKSINAATTLTALEDIYAPFRPKKRTRATIAKEKGLEPLAELLWAQDAATNPLAAAQACVGRDYTPEDGKNQPQKIADALFWFARERMAFLRQGLEQDSGLQFLVKDRFREAGAQPTRRRKIFDTGHELDLSFNFNGCNFDVEVDGPKHFIRCTDGHIITLDGPSIFQTLLIRERDRERSVVRLPYTVYDDHVERPQMWKDLCRQIKDSGPGAYIVDSYGKLTPDLLTRCSAYPVYAKD